MAEVFDTENLNSGQSKIERKAPTLGPQEARIIRVIDLGDRRPSPQFPDSPVRRKLLVILELIDDKVEIKGVAHPMISFHEVAVAKKKPSGEHSRFTALLDAAGVKGKFTLESLLGKPVLVTHGLSKTGRVEVTMVSGVSKRAVETMPQATLDMYTIELSGSKDEAVEKLSDAMRKKISEAINFPNSALEKQLQRLPFKRNEKTETLTTAPTVTVEAPF